MKNNIKRFNQFINEVNSSDSARFSIGKTVRGKENIVSGRNAVYMVTTDWSTETLENWAKSLAEMAEVAPNCMIENITTDSQGFEVTIIGSRRECEAFADYWYNKSGNQVEVKIHKDLFLRD